MYTQLGVMTKGTVIEVNVSELGLVTAGGKVVFGKYAQITNNPENDGCINAVLCMSRLLLVSHPDWPYLYSGMIPFCLHFMLYATCISTLHIISLARSI